VMKEFKEMEYEFAKPMRVNADKFGDAFDLHVTPHVTAIAETIQWYKEKHTWKFFRTSTLKP